MPAFAELSDELRAEVWACLALRAAQEVGPRRGKALIEFYGSARRAVEICLSTPTAWPEADLTPPRVATMFSQQRWREKALEEWRPAKAGNLSVLPYTHPDFPPLLREIPDPPLLLYYAGDRALLRGPAIGVVGARSCTKEGVAGCAFLSAGLSRAGVTVVSGMAKGIDRVAHLAGLEGPGRSIGVLGTGIDLVYPPENADLFRLMREEGLLLTEFPPAGPATPKSFPIRNRVISGLAYGVLVVEAAERSGSLITARLAVEQNREVFAVPGHTTAAVSAGCRDLVRRGAKAVFAPEDVLSELAPLLAEHVRASLRQKKRSEHSQARRPEEALHVNVADDAVAVLPEGRLPWVAPAGQKDAVKKKSPSSPGSPAAKPPKTASVSASAKPAPPKAVLVPESAYADLSPEERAVTDALRHGDAHLDDLSRRLGRDVAAVSGVLTILEVRGLVRRLPGAFYRLPERRDT